MLKFSLEEMKTTLEITKKELEKYSQAINTIDTTMMELEEVLKTGETRIYETLLEKYMDDKQTLFSAKEEINKFCNILQNKIIELEDASNIVVSNFE